MGTQVTHVVVQQTLEIAGGLIANAEIDSDGSLTDKGQLYVEAGNLITRQLHDYDNGQTLGLGVTLNKKTTAKGNVKWGSGMPVNCSFDESARDILPVIGSGGIVLTGQGSTVPPNLIRHISEHVGGTSSAKAGINARIPVGDIIEFLSPKPKHYIISGVSAGESSAEYAPILITIGTKPVTTINKSSLPAGYSSLTPIETTQEPTPTATDSTPTPGVTIAKPDQVVPIYDVGTSGFSQSINELFGINSAQASAGDLTSYPSFGILAASSLYYSIGYTARFGGQAILGAINVIGAGTITIVGGTAILGTAAAVASYNAYSEYTDNLTKYAKLGSAKDLGDYNVEVTPVDYIRSNACGWFDPEDTHDREILESLARGAAMERLYGEKSTDLAPTLYRKRDVVENTKNPSNVPIIISAPMPPDPGDDDELGQCEQGVSIVERQIQSKFKHAEDFGILGNYNKVRGQEFLDTIKDFINSDSVYKKEIIYRGEERCIYIDKDTDKAVLTKDGQFESGWKLDADQLEDILLRGRLS